jgi:hypothetical protein
MSISCSCRGRGRDRSQFGTLQHGQYIPVDSVLLGVVDLWVTTKPAELAPVCLAPGTLHRAPLHAPCHLSQAKPKKFWVVGRWSPAACHPRRPM